jgi:serine phosphatase RsbU (regulator of sigma subunit)
VLAIAALSSYTSVRTLILGIDLAGRIVQHDRNSADILAAPSGSLLGTALSDLLVTAPAPGMPLDSLLDAAKAGREATAVLTLRAQRSNPIDAVVTVQPMQGGNGTAAALAIVRMPPPTVEQFLDPALMRHALLDDAFRQIGATLDLEQMARGLINIAVPHFCNASGLLLLESLVADEPPAPQGDGSHLLRRLAVAADDDDPGWDAAFPTGEVLRFPPGTPYSQCMDSGRPVRETTLDTKRAFAITESWLRRPVARLLTGTSMLILPLNARGATLGFIVCTRRRGFRTFDAYDTEIGMEFAARAAIFLDNARRYGRERATALTLQRSLLPTGLSAPSSVEVRHRYLPGSQLIEVGGDWYESIALPGARVALVVGDVAGHGVRAAVTMGRLRTAIQTLAMLELPPAETLQQLNELMQKIGEREPHFATCAYATYDAVRGALEVASAGHLPPLLVRPDGGSEFLDVAPAPPLGVGEGMISSRTFDVEDGSLLVLYTDGLVESRDRDIDDGLKRLQSVFDAGSVSLPLEDLCKATLSGVYADQHRDDIAVLVARLSRIEGSDQSCWTLPGELTAAHEARSLAAEQLEKWQLADLVPIAQLLACELVTNAIRYADGPVTLRLIRENVLVCEVADSSPALPRLRLAARDEERGRGLQIVSRLSQQWGARRTACGKVVWCELALPLAAARNLAAAGRPGAERAAAEGPAAGG